MTTYTRKDWSARASRGPTTLRAIDVEGLAFHWPAMGKPLRGFDAISSALRSWQNYHMDDKGWSDIAYQVAVDQDGNRYELRGISVRSGANGDPDVNRRFGAVLLILAPGEKPSPAMLAAVRMIVREHRATFPKSKRLVGHGEIRPEPTACPGPAVMAAIKAGQFEPAKVMPPPKPAPPRGKVASAIDAAMTRRIRRARAAGKTKVVARWVAARADFRKRFPA